jgi:hypothetical protein
VDVAEPPGPSRKKLLLGGLLALGVLAAVARSGTPDDESSPWKTNQWQGYCEVCDSWDIVHIVYNCPDWIDRSTAPSWVEFESGWEAENRRCEDCGHEWTE